MSEWRKKENSHKYLINHEDSQLDKQFDCTCIRLRSPIYFGLVGNLTHPF